MKEDSITLVRLQDNATIPSALGLGFRAARIAIVMVTILQAVMSFRDGLLALKRD